MLENLSSAFVGVVIIVFGEISAWLSVRIYLFSSPFKDASLRTESRGRNNPEHVSREYSLPSLPSSSSKIWETITRFFPATEEGGVRHANLFLSAYKQVKEVVYLKLSASLPRKKFTEDNVMQNLSISRSHYFRAGGRKAQGV